MRSAETVHRYPRLLTWSVELLCTIIVLLGVVNLGAIVLVYMWDMYSLDRTLFPRIAFLPTIVDWINNLAGRPQVNAPIDLLPALGWVVLALLVAILLRNAFPMVRTGSRGMLIEFSGSWLPVRWEDLNAIKVTNDVATERFVLLVQTRGKRLTDWHRFYTLIYQLGWRRGFWITSNISEFEKLVKTILNETDRAARADEDVQPARLDEEAQSPLFRILLSPVSFFSSRAPGDIVVGEAAPPAPRPVSGREPVRGSYPSRITAIFTWGAILLAILMVWQYLVSWARFLVLELPVLRPVELFSRVLSPAAFADLERYYRTSPMPFFGEPALPNLPSPLWLLIGAHLLVLLVLGFIAVLRNLLPALEARPEGLAVQVKSGWIPLQTHWRLVPWEQITAVKATEFSEASQILLLQTRPGALPNNYRFNSLLYDGSFRPGVIVTSALSNFESVMQRVLLEITNLQTIREREAVARGKALETEAPLLQQEARSWLLSLAFKPRATVNQLVDQFRDEVSTKVLLPDALRRAAVPMAWIALLPALFVLVHSLLRGTPPGFGMILGMLLLWFIGMLEWPLICLLSLVLDDATGGGEEGYRIFYIYPRVQLPRLLPLIVTLVLLALGLAVLPLLTWVAAIVLSALLAALLWDKLYGWKSSQFVLGGVIVALWQLLLLIAYLLVQR